INGRLVRSIGSGFLPEDYTFSPDSTLIAISSNDGLLLAETESGLVRFHIRNPGVSILAIAFTPDGKRLAYGGFDGTLKLIELNLGREVLQIPGPGGSLTGLAFHPRGHQI